MQPGIHSKPMARVGRGAPGSQGLGGTNGSAPYPSTRPTETIGPMNVGLVLALAATGAVLVYGLLAWEHIVRRRREADPGTS